MSNKQDEEKPTLPIIIFKTDEVSGSSSSGKESDKDDLFSKTEKQEKEESLVVPIEEYHGAMSESEIQALKEQQIGAFPDLFDKRGFDPDIATEEPSLELSKPVKFLTDLIQAKMTNEVYKNKGPKQ